MATFLLFGNYSIEALKGISAKRTQKAAGIIKKLGGELKEGYALLGKQDLMLVVEAQGLEAAMKISIELSRQLGISFQTVPALRVDEFDRVMK